ncbi:MAG: YtxH domain-containing protein [Gemmatimonadetes bacterium]|nr:YtxH domain-containing protein [Gemmatimonadota bacterium]
MARKRPPPPPTPPDDDEDVVEEIELDEDDLEEDDLEEDVVRRRAPGMGLFAVGLLVGTFLGAAVALLTAPARGEITRRRVRRRFRNLRDDARSQLDDLREDAQDGLNRQGRKIRRRVRRRRT